MMDHKEGQHRLVRIAQDAVIHIEPAYAAGEDEDEPGPGVDAAQQLIEQGADGVAGEGHGYEIARDVYRPQEEETE